MLLLLLVFKSLVALLGVVKACNNNNNNQQRSSPPAIISPAAATTKSKAPVRCGINKYMGAASANIVGGKFALPDEFPWYVRLSINVNGSDYLCGATIISNQWLLTAAHCVIAIRSHKHVITATFADRDFAMTDGREFDLIVRQTIIHPKYDLSAEQDFDFALLKLSTELDFEASDGTIRPACLPESCDSDTSCQFDAWATIVGFGADNETVGTPTRYMKMANVKIQNQEQCRQQYLNLSLERLDITENMLCAGFLQGGVDTCLGDSGGPLMVSGSDGSYKICGVTSFGNGCAEPGFFGVYARVCSVLDWINLETNGAV